jgi:plastocyanin
MAFSLTRRALNPAERQGNLRSFLNGVLTARRQAAHATPRCLFPQRIHARGRAIMGFRTEFLRLRRHMALAFLAGAVTSLGSWMVVAQPQNTVSQKGREFHPADIAIKRGETISIVNDDGDLLHHAYIDSPAFSFDSGDQKPGSITPVAFPVTGDFKVLCAIHPKMLLVVHVR